MNSTLKQPSAWIPIALSLSVLLVMFAAIATFGAPQPEADEGVGAHLFQIWLVLEVVMIGYFAVTWLPRKPKEALLILALQIAAVLVGCAPVAYFHL